jgi:hypothetical protein
MHFEAHFIVPDKFCFAVVVAALAITTITVVIAVAAAQFPAG